MISYIVTFYCSLMNLFSLNQNNDSSTTSRFYKIRNMNKCSIDKLTFKLMNCIENHVEECISRIENS